MGLPYSRSAPVSRRSRVPTSSPTLSAVPDVALPPGILSYLQRHSVEHARLVPLTGDASDRRYYRVMPANQPPFVLALHAQPFEPGALPFVNVAALFERIPLPIPRVLGEAADLGVLAVDDLGDCTLQARLGAASAAEVEALYDQAVDFLTTMQRRGQELSDSRYLPYTLAFDVEKLTWEMGFFVRHFLEAYRGVALDPATRVALDQELGAMVAELAAEPRVLCHRDYHSRNLMVTDRGLVIIDFQDARLGPNTYDLVSLLRDSYVDLPSTLIDRLIERFRNGVDRPETREAFDGRFDLMAMQRKLKALGTFGYQTVSRSNPVYAQYVPRTLRHVRDALIRRARFGHLREILAGLVPELR